MTTAEKLTTTETPEAEKLRNALATFQGFVNDIKEIRANAIDSERKLKELTKDTDTPAAELKRKARKLRSVSDDAQFDIEVIENRIMALVKTFPGLMEAAQREHRDMEHDHDHMLNEIANKIINQPAFLEAIEQLKVALHLARNPRAILKIQDLADDNFRQHAEDAGHDYTAPLEPSAIAMAKELHRRSKEPHVIYQGSGEDLKWYGA